MQDQVAAEKERLIQLLDAARKRMHEVIEKIETQREIYPGWTLKHFLAHLTGWDDALVVSLRHHAAGREPGTPAYRGIDEYNAQTVAEREAFDYNHIFAEWEYTHQQLKTVIREMPSQRFYEVLVYPWSAHGTISRLIKIMADHELEHADEIEKHTAPKQAAEQPPAQDTAAPQLLSSGKPAEPLLLQEKPAEQSPAQETTPDATPDKQPRTGVNDLPVS
jgi:hypothetical protein